MIATIFAAGAMTAAADPAPVFVRDVVLVHGAVMDGSGWRGVYDQLHRRGHRVTIVQLPLTGLDADVAATQLAIDRAKGPVILVGHSYGGAVISEAGGDPKVRALVYVAAHQPDAGESVADLNARFPLAAHIETVGNDHVVVTPAHFRTDVAGDLSEDEAGFFAQAQRPTATAAFTTKLTKAAWRTKPSWAIVARQDHTLSPDLGRWMYARSNARVIELDASHLVYISQPAQVAAVIESAMAGWPSGFHDQ